ncbi:MAG: DUF2071 domain-containing protein [Planctomycetes bacterium]|nr:DUF2071 domain-containing protein [Planctomycetota bacterium]
MTGLEFTTDRVTRPPPGGIDVEATLSHFAIITYKVDPEKLRPHVHDRFDLDCILDRDGASKALVSMVPFLDRDFRLARYPWPRSSFGQTNYRAYVRDSRTGEHVVWFFGTALASIFVQIPRYLWKLPWHHARMRFETRYDEARHRYVDYRLSTQSKWAPCALELEDSGESPLELDGFSSLESALVLLTHPLRGYFYLRNGRLGTYTIWHDRLDMTLGRIRTATIPLFDRLGLVPEGDLSQVHSVLIQPETEFTIYLPPTRA